MAYDGRTNKMRRQEAVGMDELVRQFIREMRLSTGLNKQRIAEAWNEVSGASRYTLGVNYADGTLYCTLSSSIVRNQLYFQKDFLLGGINESLKKDELFIWDWDKKGDCVKSLVLK
jgi:hypothetical protein